MIGIMDVVDRAFRPVRLNRSELCWSKMVLPVLVAEFELTAQACFLEFFLVFVKLFKISEVVRACVITTLKDGAGIIRFPPVERSFTVWAPVFGVAFFANSV